MKTFIVVLTAVITFLANISFSQVINDSEPEYKISIGIQERSGTGFYVSTETLLSKNDKTGFQLNADNGVETGANAFYQYQIDDGNLKLWLGPQLSVVDRSDRLPNATLGAKLNTSLDLPSLNATIHYSVYLGAGIPLPNGSDRNIAFFCQLGIEGMVTEEISVMLGGAVSDIYNETKLMPRAQFNYSF